MDQKQPEGLLGRWLNVRGPQARMLQVLLILAGIGLLLLNVGSLFGGGPAPTPEQPAGAMEVGARPGNAAAPAGELARYESWLSREAETILQAVDGAGRLHVTVRLAAGPSQVLATDQRRTNRSVEEKDTAGGTRITVDDEEEVKPVILQQDQGDRPLSIREEAPRIASVVVVAEGARNARVREQLYRTAAAALAVPKNRIVVVAMEGW